MRVSFKDFDGIGVEGELEHIFPWLDENGQIQSWRIGVDFGNGCSVSTGCNNIKDLRITLDKGENPTFYPHNVVEKLKAENTRLKKENEQFYNDNEELRKKLAEYEEETKLQEELAKMKQIVINSEQAQKLSDYVNNLHNVVGELKFVPLNEIPVIHLNNFEDCQKLEAEPIKPKIASSSTEFKDNDTAEEIRKNVTSLNLSLDRVSALSIVYEEDGEEKTQEVDLQKLALEVLQKQNEELKELKSKPDDSETINLKINPEQHWKRVKNFAPPFASVSKVEMYSSDGEKIAETKTNKPDNYDEIINRLLKFRTRVEHEHIPLKNTVLELVSIMLKLAQEVQGNE